MLDVGDFEVLDECASDEEQEDEYEEDFDRTDFQSDEDDGEHENPKRRIHNSRSNERDDPNLDDNSGDNGDNVLDVNIDVSENEFLENVAKDFSENLEEEVSECPRVLRSAKKGVAPASAQKKHVEKSEPETPASRKKPGPKSKTANANVPVSPKKPIQKITFKEEEKKVVPTPKKPIQKITFNKEEFENKNKENKTANSKKAEIKVESKNESSNTNQKDSKSELKTTNDKSNAESKTPAFLQKKDLTDEEIMMHFDEIESTVLTSDTFVIENEQTEVQQNDVKPEVIDAVEEKKENVPDENWDNCDNAPKKKPFKIEEMEFAEHEMWYKDKVRIKYKKYLFYFKIFIYLLFIFNSLRIVIYSSFFLF